MGTFSYSAADDPAVVKSIKNAFTDTVAGLKASAKNGLQAAKGGLLDAVRTIKSWVKPGSAEGSLAKTAEIKPSVKIERPFEIGQNGRISKLNANMITDAFSKSDYSLVKGDLVELKIEDGKVVEARINNGVRDIEQIPTGTDYRIVKYEGVGHGGKNPSFVRATDTEISAAGKSPAGEAGIKGGGGEAQAIEEVWTRHDASAVSASPTFVHNTEDLFMYSKNIKPIEGYEDVIVHGTPNEFAIRDKAGKWYYLSPKKFAKRVMQSPEYHGGKIRLIACRSAEKGLGTGAAQELADALHVEILAPTNKAWVYPNGRIHIGSFPWTNDGTWITIKPRG